MSNIPQKAPSSLRRTQQAITRAFNRVQFELSFPSRESREYFNRAQSDLKAPQRSVARTVPISSPQKSGANSRIQALAVEMTRGAGRAQFWEPANDRGRDTVRDTGR